MAKTDVKSLCLSLMKADSEEQVIPILKGEGMWDDANCWRLYGDLENNYSAAGNQADEAEAALVEKLTNSRDAILLNECLERGIDPEGEGAPKSVREAVAKFFEENPDTEIAGQVKEWSDKKRREIARKISLYITGNKPKADVYPCINIADIGEGQTPLRIPETILSLGKSIKLRIPFTHGKFNMGGTAALAYCGKNNLQLVLSRRNPKLLKGEIKATDNCWGFTVVRRENPEGKITSSVYKYLAPINSEEQPGKGDLLSFYSDTMPILAKYNLPYSVESSWGTLIKLYEFKTRYKQSVQGSGGLLRPLDLLAPDMGLPLRLHECRYEGDPGSFEHQLNGLRVRLHDVGSNVLENGYPTSHPMVVNGNTFLVSVYAFKDEKAKTYRDSDKGIIFTLNGQSQGWLEDRFFTRNNVGLGYLKNSLLVMVDCNELDYRAQEELFMNSRDRLRKNPFRDKVEDELEKVLSIHSGLESLQEERKRKLKSEKLDDSKPLESVLANVFKHSSALSRIFFKGERLSNPFKPDNVKSEIIKFKGETYPTYFKFKKLRDGEILNREANVGSSARILFETDAENEFFTRKTNKGTHKLYIKENGVLIDASQKGFDYSLNLYNGIATLNLTLTESMHHGITIDFILEVNHVLRIIDPPFRNEFILSIKPPVQASPPSNGQRVKPPSDKPGTNREKSGGIKFPEHYSVYEAEWGSHGFDKNSSVKVVKSKASKDSLKDADQNVEFTFYINMDNIYLQYEIKDDIDNKVVLEAYYKYGVVLIGMSLIYDDTQFKDAKERFEGIEDKIADLCRAISPILIPMIKEFGELDLKNELIKELSR